MRKDRIDFSGPFAELFRGYILEKRACGFKGKAELTHLHELERWWSASEKPPALSRYWAEKFLSLRAGESDRTQTIRAWLWRTLAQYARRHGIRAYVPEAYNPQWRLRQYTPYIYTRAELGSLFLAADALGDDRTIAPRKSHTVALMLRLLYGTGMRIGEALKLLRRDVDIQNAVLTVIDGKVLKDRLLPLPPRLTERMAEFLRRFPGRDGEPVFLSPVRRHSYNLDMFHRMHYTLLLQTGLPPRRDRQGPRIHDLRHTFAVHRLEKWYRAGEDLNAKLPVLSAYLGHAVLEDTCYYLRLTESFLPEIARRSQKFTGTLLPRENDDEGD